MSPSPRWLACYHEAGHCAVALALSGEVAEVWIKDNGGGLCRQKPRMRLAERAWAERFYCVTIAGQIACARRFGEIGFSGSASDYCLCREHTRFDEDERRTLWVNTEQLVECNWRVVCLIARALYCEGRLDRRRIIELLQPSEEVLPGAHGLRHRKRRPPRGRAPKSE